MREPKKKLYNDVWFYYKKWVNHKDTEAEWQMILREGNNIIIKHNDPFARALVGEVINELGRK